MNANNNNKKKNTKLKKTDFFSFLSWHFLLEHKKHPHEINKLGLLFSLCMLGFAYILKHSHIHTHTLRKTTFIYSFLFRILISLDTCVCFSLSFHMRVICKIQKQMLLMPHLCCQEWKCCRTTKTTTTRASRKNANDFNVKKLFASMLLFFQIFFFF